MKYKKTIFFLFVILSLFAEKNGSAQSDSIFNYTGTIEKWTVPSCVFSITLTAVGAKGGDTNGGFGAKIVGVFTVFPGNVLNVLVGQRGFHNSANYGGAGGGGSFVWNSSNSNTLMIAGGGGGGGSSQCMAVLGGAGSSTTTPTPGAGAGSGIGGTGGNGGAYGVGGSPYGVGGGGCGWFSNGQTNPGVYTEGEGGGGFTPLTGGSGGAAGVGLYISGAGGFGGGGGEAGQCGACGGGGGYNGGGGGYMWNGTEWGSGGGGGSYNGGTNQVNTGGYNGAGNGKVVIAYYKGYSLLTLTTSDTNPVCGLCNGSIKVVPNGGAKPYTYLWNPGGQTNQTATGLCANTYTISVSDSCGDVSTAQVILVSPPLPVTASVVANERCNANCAGSVKATVNVGAPPYTYLWNPGGQTNQSATGLCVGAYTVTVTDMNGCTGTATTTITQPTSITAANTVNNVACYGETGSATIGPVGGSSPYTYLWNPGGQSTATVSGLSIGSYTVDINDGGGCTGTTTLTITQPTLLTAGMGNASTILCYGESASVSVTAGGGTSPYAYLWNPGGQSTATATGLSAGGYTVTVTDQNKCTATASIIITQPPLLTATMGTPNEVLCFGGTGSATVSTGGGVSPYLYVWAPSGGSNATGSGLSAGTYDVTITDRNGCTVSSGVTITQPTGLITSIKTVSYPLCNGETGSATANVSGGTSPYTYLWNPGAQTIITATGLSVGSYTVKVTDIHGCTATADISITQPAILTALISATTHVPCNGGIGNATVTAGGGTSPYTYLWSPGNQTTAKASGLAAGVYNILVKDNNGCTATNTVTITQPAVLTATMGSPNKIVCYGGTGSVTVGVTGGSTPYAYLWTPSAETNATATGLYVGSYTVTITDNHQCTASATVTMTQPTLVTAKISSTTNIGCTNGNNGTATVQGSGGTGLYTYLWNPSNETSANATGLFAGSYTVTVTDANGCSATTAAILTQPTPVMATISEPKIICKDSTGILVANPEGGTAPYKYVWSSGSTSGIATITPVATNNYSVIVTDANGCTTTANIALQFGPAFAVDISGKRSVCVGDSTKICANAIGAIDGVTYQWTPGNSTNECIGASPGVASVYTVTVIDGCGSTTTANAVVYAEPLPTVNMNVNFPEGCVPFCVEFLNGSSISKGKIAQYRWDFGNGDSSHSQQPVYCYKSSGEYNVTLTVVSDSGCSATLKRVDMVTVYSPPKAAFTYSPQSTTIENPKIQFTDKSTDRYGIAYQWWSFGDASDSASNALNAIHTYQDTGTYCATLVVMNNGGCMDTVTNCLVIEPVFKLYIPSAFTPNGDGRNEVFQPVGQYVKSFEMYVFDRWGMEIFHSTSLDQGWNGTVNGGSTISQEDVYVYKITVIDSEDTQHSYVGNVTLLK